jgi:hypothetical protein
MSTTDLLLEACTRRPCGLSELSHEEMRLDAATWFKIARWGEKSKAFHWKLAAIAKTVGEYAMGEWERSPSVKQAKAAMRAYDIAEDAGVTRQDPR